MIKHELLVPAGDIDCLKQAVLNGADAVYLGLKNFGARKFAKNFSEDNIIDALKFAHLYNVKVYVTMNTLVKDDEVDDFLRQVEFLYKNGVDAILMQDFGMICLVRDLYPNLEIHASTQANTSCEETARLFYNLGVKRVVFSREMTLDEIKNVNVPIEKEVFIHGALCISYSGCCLMSSMLGNRSGNRGECSGCCRMPYSLEIDGKEVLSNKYLLSTRELNTSERINDLLNSDITSFKIEGRMKSPVYVGFITRFYRNLIDGKNISLKEETDKLKTIFNRKFTYGHLFSSPVSTFMNCDRPNHIGLEIGKVIDIKNDKIKIKLNKPLRQEDGIRFLNSNKGFIVNFLYDSHGKLTKTASDICYVDNKVSLTENDVVMKTFDYDLNNELSNLPSRNIPINIFVKAKLNSKLELSFLDGKNTVTVYGNEVTMAKSAPISGDRIKEQVSKLGNSPFICKEIDIVSDDNIFISIGELNELRRNAVDLLIEKRQCREIKFSKEEINFMPIRHEEKFGFTAHVRNEEQLKECLELNFKRIYVSSRSLYEKYNDNERVFYKVARCIRNPFDYMMERNMVSDYYPCNDVIGDYTLNVSNIYTIYYLHKIGYKTITLSVELNDNEIIKLIEDYKNKFHTLPNVEVLVYGRVENMIIKDNILNISDNLENIYLIDGKNRRFPVIWDNTNTHILNYSNFDRKINFSYLINSIRFDFFDETKDEILKIVNKYK